MSAAESLLQELGVTEPNEIDLEAIAYYEGARVRYRPLCGCEAHILGVGSSAVITVRSNSSLRRKRFSIAHELGHWRFHRGRRLICRVDDYRPHESGSPEKMADTFAADLLMPRFMFDPKARTMGKLGFDMLSKLSDVFETSLTATAIRLIESDHTPAFIICHGSRGKKWFVRSHSVPRHWFPRSDLDPKSSAFGIQFGRRADDSVARKIEASAWFDRRDAARFVVREQTVRITKDETLSLLIVDDTKMLDDSM